MTQTPWRPIDTAPTDGTPLLAWSDGEPPHGGVRVLRWAAFPTAPWVVSWTDGLIHSYQPTHWMPLPDPPRHEDAVTP